MAKSMHWEKLPEGVQDDKTRSNENKKGNIFCILKKNSPKPFVAT